MDKGLYSGFTACPAQKDIPFKILVDAGNAPALVGLPLNNYIASVVRTSTGLYTITLSDTGRQLVGVYVDLCLSAPSAIYAQPGPSTGFGAAFDPANPPTVVIYTLNAGAVANPPAQSGGNVYLAGVITICDLPPGN